MFFLIKLYLHISKTNQNAVQDKRKTLQQEAIQPRYKKKYKKDNSPSVFKDCFSPPELLLPPRTRSEQVET